MRRLIIVFIALIFLKGVAYADSIDVSKYVNTSNSSNINSNKIINYMDARTQTDINNIFCIGNDYVFYYESFIDTERDYYNLAFSQHILTNTQLTEQQRQVNQGTLYFMYIHDPSIYDNPASASGLSNVWYKCGIKWDSLKGKWCLTDSSGFLFENLTDDKRGNWTIYVKGTDSTGKPLFDKESIGFTTFRVHKAPIPKFVFTETTTTATLADAGSYDLDYQYKKTNNGIKQYYWSAKIGGNWVDVGTGKSITFNKNGQAVTDYRLTVEDYDGAMASISKNALILEKPTVDFDFIVNGDVTDYVYQGNMGHETISVNPLITWNDEAYSSSIYTTSGTRQEKWTAVATGDVRTSYTLFNTDILKNRFSAVIQSKRIPVKLEAKNKYDLSDTTQKSVQLIDIQMQDLSGTEDYEHCGVMVGTEVRFAISLTNSSIMKEDISVKITSSALGIANLETSLIDDYFSSGVSLADTSSLWDKFSYTVNIYSKRTGELLHRTNSEIKIHTPLDLKGYINDERDINAVGEIFTDDMFTISATTLKYSEYVTVQLPIDTVDADTDVLYPARSKINLTPSANNTAWIKKLKVVNEAVTDDMIVPIVFEAIAFNKRDKETGTLSFKLVTYRLENFRIVKVRDVRLEGFYKNAEGKITDKPKYVNDMAIDPLSFYPYAIDSLTKGYMFEFEIDAINFNDDADKIVITPSFYSITGNYRNNSPNKAYWEDSSKVVWEVGSGGHSDYNKIILTKGNRTIINNKTAVYRGQYFIPGTTFLSSSDTVANAKNYDLQSDIIVNFDIEGYKANTPRFNYNLKRWEKERTVQKFPYKVGDVLRYGAKSNLDDLHVIRVRP